MANILMVSAEASPFASTGGLGDVLYGLPKALAEQGHKVGVAVPLYPRVRQFKPELVREKLRFPSAGRLYSADIYRIPASGVDYLFVDLPELFDRPSFYGELEIDYPDNALRFAGFCRAALAIAESVFPPDIVHCHDWSSGFLPVLLKQRIHAHPALMGLKSVFTIHNLAHQGPLTPQQAGLLGLNGIFKQAHPTLLRGALETADEITTVSPSYAAEIRQPGLGCGLEAVMAKLGNRLHGILNGIDRVSWNPATDTSLAAQFSSADLSGKRIIKAALLKEMGLPAERIERPLIGAVPRLTRQKGLDLLSQNPQQFIDLDATLVVLGEGNPDEEDFFRWMAGAYPRQVAVRIGFDRPLGRRITAGSDVYLMPSRFEPCGLNQLYAMRYGTLPLVHATGGLKDTVSKANGFVFQNPSWRSLLEALREMNATWGTPNWRELQKAAMAADFSWDAAASRYAALYSSMNHN